VAKDGVRMVEVPAGTTVDAMIARLGRDPRVEVVEPDYLLHLARTPNDPDYSRGLTWGLNNIQGNGGDIGAVQAWARVTDARDVVVAVIDTGIRTTHEDLAANLWVNPGEIPGNGVDDDRNGYVDDVHGINVVDGTGDPWDEDGHGTHVAGIIGAVGNNGRGTVGVAWRVRLMGLRFLAGDADGSVSGAIECLNYARTQGAHLVNASWGNGSRSILLERALLQARDAGVIVVAAAGNHGRDMDREPFYPAGFSAANIVSVTATTRSDGLASYANYGRGRVDLAAPGDGIHSTWHTSDNAYRLNNGTSMAAPFVTGGLALMKAVCPGCSYGQLITALLDTVDRLPALEGKVKSGGRLNLGAAVARLMPEPPTAPILAWGGEGVRSGTLVLMGQPGRAYRLEMSADLVAWSTAGEQVADADGRVETEVVAPLEGVRFWRARVAE
jgi:subtilisin family serine protease